MASRTHFEVLGLGLEASSPQKLPCPRLEDSNIFCTVEILLENARNLAENLRRPFLFSAIGDGLKNFIIRLLVIGEHKSVNRLSVNNEANFFINSLIR